MDSSPSSETRKYGDPLPLHEQQHLLSSLQPANASESAVVSRFVAYYAATQQGNDFTSSLRFVDAWITCHATEPNLL